MDLTSFCFGLAIGIIVALFLGSVITHMRAQSARKKIQEQKLKQIVSGTANIEELHAHGFYVAVDKMTYRKTSELLEKQDSKFTGFVLTTAIGERVVVEMGAVRFLSNKEWWDVMHPTSWGTALARAELAADNAPVRHYDPSNVTLEQLGVYAKEDPTESWMQEQLDFTKIRSVKDTIADLKELVDLTDAQKELVSRAALWLSGLADVNEPWWTEFIRLVDLLTDSPGQDLTRESLIELVSRVVATPVDAH